MPAATASTISYDHGIVAVDADYVRPKFDATHLIVEQGRAAYVDTGTHHSVPHLLDALARYDIDAANVDYLFVTHVHLDHAGGAGELLRHLPNAKAVLHPRGAPHIIDPAKLVRGTIDVYGEQQFLDMYEQVVPAAADRVVVTADGESFRLAGRELVCFFTEGHARHHYCVWDAQSNSVFAGDSFGVSYRELDTAAGEFIFPSTTPIDFDPAAAHISIDRIMSYEPQQIFITHYSRIFDLQRLADNLHDGIDFLEDLARRHAASSDRTTEIAAGMFANFFQRLQTHGFSGEEETARQILQFDIRINTMGLDVWLRRMSNH